MLIMLAPMCGGHYRHSLVLVLTCMVSTARATGRHSHVGIHSLSCAYGPCVNVVQAQVTDVQQGDAPTRGSFTIRVDGPANLWGRWAHPCPQAARCHTHRFLQSCMLIPSVSGTIVHAMLLSDLSSTSTLR